MRREYPVKLTLNGRSIKRVQIDSHYEVRHSSSITDELILKLVQLLDGEERAVESVTPSGFEVFRIDPIYNAFRVHVRKRVGKE